MTGCETNGPQIGSPASQRYRMDAHTVTRRDEVLSILARQPDGLTDADLARLTSASHQAVNQTCRHLAAEDLIRWDDLSHPMMNFATGDPPRERPPTATIQHNDWFWEGNVQGTVARHLVGQGATLHSVADTAARARGTDIVAVLEGRMLHIKVKGWPSTTYADPRRASETKRTQPSLQAKHWYADAVHSALRLRAKHPDDQVVIAFPDMARYRHLAAATATPLRAVGIDTWFVTESGEVTDYDE
jgi:hypothetical protein